MCRSVLTIPQKVVMSWFSARCLITTHHSCKKEICENRFLGPRNDPGSQLRHQRQTSVRSCTLGYLALCQASASCVTDDTSPSHGQVWSCWFEVMVCSRVVVFCAWPKQLVLCKCLTFRQMPSKAPRLFDVHVGVWHVACHKSQYIAQKLEHHQPYMIHGCQFLWSNHYSTFSAEYWAQPR